MAADEAVLNTVHRETKKKIQKIPMFKDRKESYQEVERNEESVNVTQGILVGGMDWTRCNKRSFFIFQTSRVCLLSSPVLREKIKPKLNPPVHA
jgi:hypothetical protein